MNPTTSQAKSTVQCLDHPFYWWGKGYWANKRVSRGESCEQGNRRQHARKDYTIIKK